jgi:hypothetical protein
VSKQHVSLNGMALRGVNVVIDDEPDGRIAIRVDLHVAARDTCAPIRTSTITHRLPPESDGALRVAIREVVLTALGHEVDEWLSIDGIRHDPHIAPCVAVGRAPHAATSDAVKAKLAAMTPAEVKATFVDAGIIDESGALMPLYSDTPGGAR